MDDLSPELIELIQSAFQEQCREMLRLIERTLEALGSEDDSAPLRELKRHLHTLKGAAAATGLDDFAMSIHQWEDAVDADQGQGKVLSRVAIDDYFRRLEELSAARAPDNSAPEQGSTRASLEPKASAQSELATPPREAAPRGVAPGPSPAPGATPRIEVDEFLRVRPQRIDALDGLLGDLSVVRLQSARFSGRLNDTRRGLSRAMSRYRQLSSQLRALLRQLPAQGCDGFSKGFEALGAELQDSFREAYCLAREIPLNQDQEQAILGTVEGHVRALRLMPLQSFFEEYAKVARQAARYSGREVKLRIEARGAELDRPVLLKLRDPLLHLVRNAVVHGIETPAERSRLGKPEIGSVMLEGVCEGGRATIRISDDGAGIDEAKVRRRALESGLLSPDQASSLPLIEILTLPGFSTRSEADDLAGRGVGLDVVQSRVRELDGVLELSNIPGVGACFSLKVPVSTSTSLGLILRCESHRFGLLLDHIDSVIRVASEDICSFEGREVVMVGESPVAILPLASLLGLEPPSLGKEKLPAVVLSLADQRLALLVDDIPGEQSLVVKNLGEAFAGLRSYMGAAIQADSQILPILQVSELFARAKGEECAGSGANPLRSETDRGARSVLVVDDSITMRTLEQNILQAAGYQVTVAEDGVVALDLIASSGGFDVVVTDLQMPRLDGVDLCSAIRGSTMPHTPIVMVTSVGDNNEKQRALSAGADAYIVKADFEQRRFLDCVARLAGTQTR